MTAKSRPQYGRAYDMTQPYVRRWTTPRLRRCLHATWQIMADEVALGQCPEHWFGAMDAMADELERRDAALWGGV
jgi:hypothetical protein